MPAPGLLGLEASPAPGELLARRSNISLESWDEYSTSLDLANGHFKHQLVGAQPEIPELGVLFPENIAEIGEILEGIERVNNPSKAAAAPVLATVALSDRRPCLRRSLFLLPKRSCSKSSSV